VLINQTRAKMNANSPTEVPTEVQTEVQTEDQPEDQPEVHKRPPGRPPSGCTWDSTAGNWVGPDGPRRPAGAGARAGAGDASGVAKRKRGGSRDSVRDNDGQYAQHEHGLLWSVGGPDGDGDMGPMCAARMVHVQVSMKYFKTCPCNDAILYTIFPGCTPTAGGVLLPGHMLKNRMKSLREALNMLRLFDIDLCIGLTPTHGTGACDDLMVCVAANPTHAMFEGETGFDVMLPLTTAKKARKE
jgi:hypothetical protein